MSVLIADDHGVVRQGLRMFLPRDPDLLVVGEASNGQEPQPRRCHDGSVDAGHGWSRPLGGDQSVGGVVLTGREEVGVPEPRISHGRRGYLPSCHRSASAGVFMSKPRETLEET